MNILKKIKKFNDSIIYNTYAVIFIFLAFFKPLLLYYYDNVNKIYNVVMAICGIFIIISYIVNLFITKKISKLQISIILFMASLFISTLFGTRDFTTFFKTYIKWLAISMYTEMLIKNEPKKLLDCLSKIIFVYIILHFLTMLIFPNGIFNPDGMTAVLFLGNDNTTTITVTLGILFICFRSFYYYKRLDLMSILSLILILFVYLKNWSVTSLIGLFLVITYFIFFYKRNINTNIFNFKNYVIGGLLCFLFLVVFRIQNNFQWFIENILNKSVTFTGRTNIWDNCLFFIKNNFILGLGVQEFEVREKLISIFHAHCTYLNILLEGGIIGFIFYLNIFRITYAKIKNIKGNELLNMLSFGIFIFLFVGIVEVYQDSQMLYIFLVMIYYFDDIVNRKPKGKEKTKEFSFE